MSIFDRGWGSHSDLQRMQREVDRLLRETGAARRSQVYPPINIYDAEDGYHLPAEVPGIDPDSLDISVTRNEVVVQGERVRPPADEGARFHRRERDFGKFSRAFALPEHIDSAGVAATYRNGVLELVAPRIPEAGPRKVTVQSE